MDEMDHRAGISLPFSSSHRALLSRMRRNQGFFGTPQGRSGPEPSYHPLVAYMAAVLAAELLSFLASKAAKNPRYYLGHEVLFAYIGGIILLINWLYKNYMLAVKGIDLLPPLN